MFTAETGVVITGALLVIAAIWILWRAQSAEHNPVDFATMLVDQKDGSTSLRKVGELVALLTTTWIILYMAVKGDLTETFYVAYLGVWVSRTVLGVLAGAKASAMESANPPPQMSVQASGLPPAIRRP